MCPVPPLLCPHLFTRGFSGTELSKCDNPRAHFAEVLPTAVSKVNYHTGVCRRAPQVPHSPSKIITKSNQLFARRPRLCSNGLKLMSCTALQLPIPSQGSALPSSGPRSLSHSPGGTWLNGPKVGLMLSFLTAKCFDLLFLLSFPHLFSFFPGTEMPTH